MRQELLVRRPGEYRLTLRERDTNDREVVSTTIRTADAFYTYRRHADGSTELHVIRGARPSLGVELDNLLGQTVQAVGESTPLKVVGRGSRNDRPADKLELGPGRFVWVDQATGLPVEEQVVSGDKVVHSVRITAFDDQVQAPDGEFDPASLGAADTTTVEDLGFRPGVSAQAAAREIGFTPLDVPAPEGFSADLEGYVDPRVPNGDAPAEAAYVSLFSRRPAGVIVTQVARPGTGDSFVPADADEGSSKRVEVGGRPAVFFGDPVRPRLVFARRDVLVTVEGNLAESATDEVRGADPVATRMEAREMRGLSAVVAVACLLGVLVLPGCARPDDAGPTSVATSARASALASCGGRNRCSSATAGRWSVREGEEHEIAANGAEKLEVAYSADGEDLLVTEAQGTRRVVRMVAADAVAPGAVVLESGDGSNLGPVRAVTARGRLYRAVFGDPVNRLVVSGLAPGSKSSNVALRGTFSGEFDVDATGASIVYTGTGQNPATVMLRSGSTERPLVAGLATAFTPSFSRDGERICLTGSERAGGDISVYIVDVESGEARVLGGTEGLNPTSPVFSPDGESVAFRSATDGVVWIVSVAGGEPDKLALTADEAPISW